MIRTCDERIEKLKIQVDINNEQIKQMESLKSELLNLVTPPKSGTPGNVKLSPVWLIIFFLPFLLLFFFVLYLRYKQKKELKSINDNLHSYLNESKKLIGEMTENLERTTAEAVEKAKGRIRILELLVAEAGQKIKPLNSQTKKAKPEQPQPFIKREELTQANQDVLSGGNLLNRYKSVSSITSKPPAKQMEREDKAGMIALMKRKGMSISEIASKMDMGKGEVELILNIQKRKKGQ